MSAKSCLTLCDPMDCSLPGSSVHGDIPGKNTGVSCHALLQGIFPTQGSNPGLLHCRQTLYQLSYKGSPNQVYCNIKQKVFFFNAAALSPTYYENPKTCGEALEDEAMWRKRDHGTPRAQISE